jgi:hypothetical protein
MKKKSLTSGDIFYLEAAPEIFVFGRALFDVEKQGTKLGIEVGYDNYLSSFGGCQLIEIYKGLHATKDYKATEVLIPRVFVYNLDSKINKVAWGKIGHQKIDYRKIEFPEVIGNADSKVKLMQGELSFVTKFTDAEEIGIMWGPIHPVVVADANLFLQDRKDLIVGFVERPLSQ